MPQTVVPMIHVPDVTATIDWYTSIGFKLIRQNEEAGEVNWAKLSFGNSELMVNAGGKTVVEGPHDTFYGMREFIMRDVNGFWVTFGQPMQT